MLKAMIRSSLVHLGSSFETLSAVPVAAELLQQGIAAASRN